MTTATAEREPAPPAPSSRRSALDAMTHELSQVEGQLLDLEQAMRAAIESVPPDHRDSARNLVH